jgi:hypothetical protein
MGGLGPDGSPLPAGDTYHSLETISEDSSPDGPCEGELVEPPPRRPVPSRSGLPLTEAVGRLWSRSTDQERRVDRLELAVGILAAALLVQAVLIVVLLWLKF